MEIEIPVPDLTTPEGVKKSMSDIFAAARALGADNAALKTQMGALKADLATATQALTEQQRIAAAPVMTGPESELRQFVRADGRIRAVGEATAEDSWMPGLLDTGADYGPWHADLKRMVEERNIIRAIRSAKDPSKARHAAPKTDRKIAAHLLRAPLGIAKAFGDISTQGAEWIPDVMMPVVEKEFMEERKVASLFATMPMSAKNMLLPFLSSGLRPYLKGAVAGDDPAQYASSSLTTAQRSIDSIGFATRAQMDEEASEDSLIDGMGLLREELISALVDAEEDAIINGDSTATHADTGIANWDIRGRWGTTGLGTAADHRRAWIGLRHRATDVTCTTDAGSTQTFAGFQLGRAAMDAPHGRTGDLVAITSLEYMLAKISQFAEVVTLDKFGPQASIFTGQIASIGGVPVILSDFVDKQYNASGIFDNTTKTKSVLILANRKRFKIGMRRGSAVEIDKDITRGIFNLVSTSREIFFTFDSSTKKNVHVDYNLFGVS